MKNWVISAIVISLWINGSFAQDTTLFHQENASMFSNSYGFIKQSKFDNFGRFYQFAVTDDMQTWYGHGVFTETESQIKLIYDISDHHNRVHTNFIANNKDTIHIRWFDWWAKPQTAFTVRFNDTTKHKNFYRSDFDTGILKIPTRELVDKKLGLYGYFSRRKIIEFQLPAWGNEVNIFAIDTSTVHPLKKKTEALTKTANGFVTIGMFAGNTKTNFILSQN